MNKTDNSSSMWRMRYIFAAAQIDRIAAEREMWKRRAAISTICAVIVAIAWACAI